MASEPQRIDVTHHRAWVTGRKRVLPSTLIIALASGIFVLDLMTPLGIAVWVLYLPVILAATYLDRQRDIVLTTAACLVLTVAGYFASPAGVPAMWGVTNRMLGLAAIWLAAIAGRAIVRRSQERERAEEALRQLNERLEQQVAGRTHRLQQVNDSLLSEIEKHRQAEESVRANESRLRGVLDTAIDGIVAIDEHGAIELVNPAMERMFGYSIGELLGKNVSVLMPSPHRDQHDGYLREYLRTGHKKIIGIGRELEALHKDGSTFPVELAVSEGFAGQTRFFTGVIRDITERRRLTQQLLQRESLARIGQMAAIVAHEVRNPLAAISGAIEIIGEDLPEDHPHRPIVREILTRTASLNESISDILEYARPSKPAPAPISVRDMLVDITALLQQDATFRQVEITIRGDDKVVPCDGHMLKSALLNIMMNAAQAMAGTGRIDVDIGGHDGDCRIVIRDDGPGIPPDARRRIFEPFFTTKSRGTGLGLPIARQAIEAHGGDIAVDCPQDGGTVVAIRLPL